MAVEAEVSARTFALSVRGDLMVAPDGSGFPAGCTIVVDPNRAPQNGDFVVVLLSQDSEPILRQLQIEGPHQFLKTLNPRYPIHQLAAPPYHWGVVVESILRKRYPSV